MSDSDELLRSLLNEYDKFRESGSVKTTINDTQDLISQLKQMEQQLVKEIATTPEDGPSNTVAIDNIIGKASESQSHHHHHHHHKHTVKTMVQGWKDKVTKNQKQANNNISKMLKFIDNKVYDFDLIEEINKFDERIINNFKLTEKNKNNINEVILQHLTREISSYGTNIGDKERSQYENLIDMLENTFDYKISRDFKKRLNELRLMIDSIVTKEEPNLTLAFKWCEEHDEELKDMKSDLKFKLHELQFYLLFYGINSPDKFPIGSSDDRNQFDNLYSDDEFMSNVANDSRDDQKFSAYLYAKQNFGKLFYEEPSTEKFSKISKLFASTVFPPIEKIKKHDNSEFKGEFYSKMFVKNIKNYKKIISQIIHNFCFINHFEEHSSLYYPIISSFISLPHIIKFNEINTKLQRSLSTASVKEKHRRSGFISPFVDDEEEYDEEDDEEEEEEEEEEVLARDHGFELYRSRIKSKDKNDEAIIDDPTKDELPLELELPVFLQNNHPIFICPISRQETTEKNPAILLPCNHIISKQSLTILSESKSRRYGRQRRSARVSSDYISINRYFESPNNEVFDETPIVENEIFNTNDVSDNNSEINYDFELENNTNIDHNNELLDEDTVEYLPGNNRSENLNNDQAILSEQDRDRNLRTEHLHTFGSIRSYYDETRLGTASFKCPYCPQICHKKDTKKVFFGTC